MIDVEKLEAAATATFDVVVGEGTGFRVMGSASEAFATAKRMVEISDIKTIAAAKERPDVTTDAGAGMAADNQRRRQMTILRHCVVGWHGFALKSKELPFTPENLERVLKVSPQWIDRLLLEIEDDANFTSG